MRKREILRLITRDEPITADDLKGVRTYARRLTVAKLNALDNEIIDRFWETHPLRESPTDLPLDDVRVANANDILETLDDVADEMRESYDIESTRLAAEYA